MSLPKRKPNRLKDWDYSRNGAYFITICTKERQALLGRIDVGFGACDEPKTVLSAYGLVVEKHIRLMQHKYSGISIDKYVIMPNHVHLILLIQKESGGGGALQAPHPTNADIPKFVSLLKRHCNYEYRENIWQKSYHDHIIRGEKDYQRIWEYIENNPLRWKADCFYCPSHENRKQ